MIRFLLILTAIAFLGLAACESPLDVETPRVKTPIDDGTPPSPTGREWVRGTMQLAGVHYLPVDMSPSSNDVVFVDTSTFPPSVRLDIEPVFIPDSTAVTYPTYLRIKLDSLQLSAETTTENYFNTDPVTTPNGSSLSIIYFYQGGMVPYTFTSGEPFNQGNVSGSLPYISFSRAWRGVRTISGYFHSGLVFDKDKSLDTEVQMDFTITW